MKDFVKKLISAAMALVLTASMSVYAEEAAPVENVNGSVSAIITGDAVNGAVGCANHVTFRTNDYIFDKYTKTHHVFDEDCTVTVEKYQYDLICMKCNEVKHIFSKTIETHSVNHP